MNFDKKSLIEYDYKLYLEQYEKIEKDLKSDNYRNDEDLTKEDLLNWLEKGIFTRRLKFRKFEENFYITTAKIKRGKGQFQEIKFGDNYLYSYWDKQKVEGFLSRTINDNMKDDRLQQLDLIGKYVPNENNLINVQYETKSGKEFIKNSINFINGIDEVDSIQKIDIKDFFRLNFELAEQGIQAKVLYEENNCIIEGMAGTGKSTIALQKLKYFSENYNFAQDKMIVIVKNYKLKSHFLTLLEDKNIELSKIKILAYNELPKKNFNAEDFIKLRKISNDIVNNIDNIIEKRDIESLISHYKSLFNGIGIKYFQELLNKKIEKLNIEENILKTKVIESELEELNLFQNNDEEIRKK